ncbi:Zinc-finger homeodomain protein 4, partial [Mucuna pruriens]
MGSRDSQPKSKSRTVQPFLKNMESSNFHGDKRAEKKIIRYKECLKNHAAAIGGNATDGCGEFMAAGEEGTPEALMCSACNCHRNFHRKEIDQSSDSNSTPLMIIPDTTQIRHVLAHLSPNKSGSISPSDMSDEKDYEDGVVKEVGNSTEKVKKRFRTKFTQEQKEKMLGFAERAGWRIQKLEESVVQKFCQEIGIKRTVLKVWMHNNKNTFAKRNPSTS